MSSTIRSAAVSTASAGSSVSDSELLKRFLREKSEAAFGELIARYGKLVYAVALRVVRDRHAAEDVFQSTFLVLARDAVRIRRHQSLSAWLHGVALRQARKALSRRSRLRSDEANMLASLRSDPFEEIGTAFDQQVLDEELQRLPAVYREPLVLHYLQSLTYAETAAALGVSIGVIEGRLRRGKRELHLRMARRGVGMSVALGALCWSQSVALAAANPELMQTTLSASLAISQGTPFPSQCSSEAVQLAATGTTSMLTIGKMTTIASALLLAVAAGYVAGEQTVPGVIGGERVSSTADSHLAAGRSGAFLLAALDEPPEADNPFAARLDAEADAAKPQSAASDSERAEPGSPVPAAMPGSGTPGTVIQQGDTVHVDRTTSPREERILQALSESTTEFGFVAIPLQSVLASLSDFHEIPILMDLSALADAGLTGEEEITLVMKGITLRSGLNLILGNINGVELAAIVEDEVLKVTTREVAKTKLTTRIYDVTPLHVTNPLSLANVIQSGTSGDWPSTSVDYTQGVPQVRVSNPGPSISFFNGSFVIRQTQQVHEEIEDLLNRLARQIDSREEIPNWPDSPLPAGAMGGEGGAGFF